MHREKMVVLLIIQVGMITIFGTQTQAQEKPFLFSVGLDPQGALDSNIILGMLRREFGARGIQFSEDAALSEEKPGSRWLVTVGDKQYVARKEEDKLDVYERVKVGEITNIKKKFTALSKKAWVKKAWARDEVDLASKSPPLDLHVGDSIRTGENTCVVAVIDGEAMGFKPGSRGEFTLKEDSVVTVKDLLQLLMYDGDIEIESERLRLTVQTHNTSTASTGTHFQVISRGAGTMVDVLGGKVELTRTYKQEGKGEQKGKPTTIIRDYQAVVDRLLFRVNLESHPDLSNEEQIPKLLQQEFSKRGFPLSQGTSVSVTEKGHKWLIADEASKYFVVKRGKWLNIYDDKLESRPSMVVSYRPRSWQLAFTALPGANRLYGRPDKLSPALTVGASILTLAGFAYFNGQREGAVNASINSYNTYMNEIRPGETSALYEQYQKDRRHAKISRNRQIGCVAIYGGLIIREIITYWLTDLRDYSGMTEEFRESTEDIRSDSSFGLKTGDGAILAEARWHLQ
jgi:hypothetical protein